MVFARELVEGSWNWALPRLSTNGAWDEHVKRVLQNGRKKSSQVHSNRDIDLTARRLLWLGQL